MTAEQEVKKFFDDFEKAARKNDVGQLEQLIDEEFAMVDPTGRRIDKQQMLAEIRDHVGIEDYQRNKHDVRISGDHATHTSVVGMKGRFKSRDVSGQYQETHTFVRRGQGWKLVGVHMTRVTAPGAA